MGTLVPFGEPWRIGANEATAIYLPVASSIGSANLPKGWYSLYAVPGAQEWKVVVNGVAQRWGVPINAGVMAKDIGSVTVPVQPLDTSAEALKLHLEKVGANEAVLVIEWERTRVRVPVLVDVVARPVGD
jgi:hypothetical protein